jgi:predicted transposase YbfD/YdcC
MNMPVKLSSKAFVDHFGSLEDPRVEGMCDHLLLDILVIAIVATVCGADGWDEIHAFGVDKIDFLRTILTLENGIPSVSTFQRVFARIHPQRFEAAFRKWTAHLVDHSKGRLIALDGKTLRGVIKRALSGHGLHLVHAWAVGNRLLLGQLATEVKSNEIKAIPELLRTLDLTGAVVTVDAAGTQTEIVDTILDGGGDYILAVKANQPTLHEIAKNLFARAAEGDPSVRTTVAIDDTQGHGRVERRRIVATAAPVVPELARWKGLESFILVESERRVGDRVTHESRYYIASLPPDNPASLGANIRGHWSVENPLHWHLDVAFNEDASMVSAGHGAENLSLLRKIVLTMMTRDKSRKLGIAANRKRAGWNDEHLLKILAHGMIG